MQTIITTAPSRRPRSARSHPSRRSPGHVSRSMPRTIVDHHTPPTWDRPRGAVAGGDSSTGLAFADATAVAPSAWPPHLWLYRAPEAVMYEDEIDQIGAELGGEPKPVGLLERAFDGITAILARSVGTRSWTTG